MSHTYATMAVPKRLFDIVKEKLTEAGYEHAIIDRHDSGVITELDMHGIALVVEDD
jgi:hypothetical protein